jgi:hypothetical protein
VRPLLLHHTAPWALVSLLALDLAARRLSDPEVLLRLGVASYPTCFAHRLTMARQAPAGVGLMVVGDSTAERGVNACTLAEAAGTEGLNLSLPSGAIEEASAVRSAARGVSRAGTTLVYAVNPLNTRAYSEWISPRFSDRRRHTDLASTLLGDAFAVFGRRQQVTAVIESFLEPARYREEFHGQIGLTGRCGRETPPPSPAEIPDEAGRARQVKEYSVGWLNVFSDELGEATEAGLEAGWRAWKAEGPRVVVVLTPLRPDFRAFLEQKYPGQLRARREIFARAARRAQVEGLACGEAVDEVAEYVDPVHLNETGRRAFSACLGRQLRGAGPCCPPLEP